MLGIKDEQELVNPYYASEPLAPYTAFKRAKVKIDLEKVFKAYKELSRRHEVLIIEGAGGLLAPIKEGYLVADLIRDLDVPAVIVSRAGLGTINHTLLTQRYALDYGIKVKGVIINGYEGKDAAEKTNPKVIKEFLEAPFLGVMPHIKDIRSNNGLKVLAQEAKKHIDLKSLLKVEKSPGRKLAEADKQYLWHPFTQMQDWIKDQPLIIEEAKGSYLKDTNGRWYLDGVSSLWVNVHGHRKKEIDAAVKRQLNKLAHSTLLGLGNVPSIELARRLMEIAPKA